MTIEELCAMISVIMGVDYRSLEQRALKTTEEVGEMCEAICSSTGAPGCEYKNKTSADVVEEAWDVVICGISVALHAVPGMTMEEHEAIITRKLDKWKRKVKEGKLMKNGNE